MRWICVLLSLLLSACGMRVALHGELDPAYAPAKSDSVAMVLPDNSSIADRQVYATLLRGLKNAGFQLVDVQDAKWILGVGTHNDTIFSGISSSGLGVANTFGGVGVVSGSFGSSKAEYESKLTIYCWLYSGAEFRAGKRLPAWGGTEITTPEDFLKQPDKLVAALIDIYGKNFYDERERVSQVKGDVSPQ